MYQRKGFKTKTGKYKKEYDEKAFRLALLGCTDKILSEVFEVSLGTIDYWKQHKPSFAEAIKKGRIEADSRVALGLYQRATGYSHSEIHSAVRNGKRIIFKEIQKHYPPDSFAALKWLTMRQREKWADVQKVEHTVSGQIDHNVIDQLMDDKEFSDEDLKVMLKLGLKKAQKDMVISDN